ncbi:response regulator transcription factor [Rhizobium grahamii]|uniref:Response regulator transcription factor n=1 Tax=Rhizobium grahamii TaxID=1120045 RepID=A0A370KTF6_9HYPH|nr:response regulator [Rhizobium grahamii]RDJ13932.1 hypothetical protein B5K06_08165 [Rhizobium grahamii]
MPRNLSVVFILDSDPSFRSWVGEIMVERGWASETFASGKAFLSSNRAPVPSCLIVDERLPDCTGLDIQRLLAEDRKAMPIIFVSEQGDVRTAVKAIQAGAIEYLIKPASAETLVAAVDRALEASSKALAAEHRIQRLKSRYETLSPREHEVTDLVVTGLLNKQVAYQLGISEVTVKWHRGTVMRKMDARSVIDLASMAAKLGHSGGLGRADTPAQVHSEAAA